MKLLTRCIYALLFMGGSLILNASVEPTVSIRSQKGQSFSVHLKDINNEAYKIKLSDQFGAVLINEKVENKDDYLKFFNLKNLPTGNYLMRVESERKISLQTISISNGKLSIKTSDKKEIFKPSVRFEYPNLDLNMIHFEDEGVNILIKDKADYELHKDEFFLTGSIPKRFEVTALPLGDYIIEIKTKNYTYEQGFSINAENKLKINTFDDKRIKLIKKTKGPKKSSDAIMSKIKWIQSQRN